MKLVSVLIPSLGRFDGLLAAVDSFYKTADNLDRMEVLVRLHSSDEEARRRHHELPDTAQVFFAQDKPPGASNAMLWEELRDGASGTWLQFWSDDMTIEGHGWDSLLEGIAPNCVVQPEWHQLNNSRYQFNTDGPTPFVPAALLPPLAKVPDTFVYEELVVKQHLPVTYLPGICVNHQRVEDATTALANAT